MDRKLFPVPIDTWKSRLGLPSPDHAYDELRQRERLARAMAKPIVADAVAPPDLSTHHVVVQPLFDDKAHGNAAGMVEKILSPSGVEAGSEDSTPRS